MRTSVAAEQSKEGSVDEQGDEALDRLSRLVVAIDGPAGVGKSTVAREVARRLRLRYLDTGAMYRAITAVVLSRRVDIADRHALADAAAGSELDFRPDPDHPQVFADGRDLTAEIRSDPVTAAVSAVSSVPEVRRLMVAEQRRIIGSGGIVVEGRDIGSVVMPDAPVKVFLTAAASERAARRAREYADQRPSATVAEDLARRDQLDSTRTTSPLVRPADALTIDTTDLSVEEVVDLVVARCEMALAEPLGPAAGAGLP